MVSSISVLVLVVASQTSENAAMVTAVRESMGSDVQIVVRTVDELPSEDEALALASSLHVDAVVEAAWQKEGERRAMVGVHLAWRAPWTHREIGFRASDDPAEQGRTVGFVVASMLPDAGRTPPAAAPESAAPKVDESLGADARGVGSGTDASQTSMGGARVQQGRAADMTFTFLQPTGGYPELGASLRFRWPLVSGLSAHVGGSARYGRVPPADANILAASFVGGIGYQPLPEHDGTLGLGIRLEAGAKYLAATRFANDAATPEFQSRVVAASSLVLDASLGLGAGFSAILSVGPEITFGRTDFYTHQQPVATLSAAAVLVDVGIRSYF